VFRIRHKNARTVTKLARAFAALDRDAGTVRPAPKRASRGFFGA
jgi:hypothetical protein